MGYWFSYLTSRLYVCMYIGLESTKGQRFNRTPVATLAFIFQEHTCYHQELLTICREKKLDFSGFPDTMRVWTFYDFLDGRGCNSIREWMDSLPAKIAAKIDTRIIYMQAIEVWPEQFVSSLVGYPDIFELRIASFGAQYRSLCCYGPTQREVTIVLGATEKGKLSRRVLDNATRNTAIVRADRMRIEPHVFVFKGSDTAQSED
jgi:Gp49-like protein DUF891